MPLRAVLPQDEFDALDDGLRDFYKPTQKGDAFVLDLEGIDDHPTVKGLANTLRRFKEIEPDATKLRAIKAENERLKGAWAELDPEETRAALERLEALESGEGGKDVAAQLESLRGAMERKMAKAVEAKDTEILAREQALAERDTFIESLTLDRELDESLAHVKAIEDLRPGAKAYLKLRYRPKVERVENPETGKAEYRGVVPTETGDDAISDFIEKWSRTPEAQPYLEATGNAGTGSKTSDGSGFRRTNPFAKETFNLTEQGRIAKEKPALAAQLRAQAGGKA
jgi:hypothetical protein